MGYRCFFILQKYYNNSMELITNKKIEVVTISGIVLTLLSMTIAIIMAFAMGAVIQWKGNESFYELMTVSILAFGIYYISFAALSKLFAKRLNIAKEE